MPYTQRASWQHEGELPYASRIRAAKRPGELAQAIRTFDRSSSDVNVHEIIVASPYESQSGWATADTKL